MLQGVLPLDRSRVPADVIAGSRLVLAELDDRVRAELDRYGVTDAIGTDAMFDTVEAAVAAFAPGIEKLVNVDRRHTPSIASSRPERIAAVKAS